MGFEKESARSDAAKAPGTARASATTPAQTASTTRSRSVADSSSSAEQRPPSSDSNPSANAGTGTETHASPGQQTSVSPDYERLQCSASVIILAMAIASVFPTSSEALALRCYYVCLTGYFLLAVSDIYHKHGIPTAFSLSALQLWFSAAGSGPEVLVVLNAGAFLPQPLLVAVIPVACHVSLPVAEFLQRRASQAWVFRTYLQDPCTWVTTHRNTVKLYAANMEIFLGLLLIALMFTPQRSLITLVFYWQVLRAEFHSPVTAQYHKHAWGGYEEQVEPVLRQHVPFIMPVVNFFKEWFRD